MYLKNDGFSGYDSSGAQIRTRGLFLIMIQPESHTDVPIKLAVRKVALKQLGHWMMGCARVYGHSITVSGSYGSDGLPCSVPQDVYDRLTVELPKELHEAWNKGGGHNGAGSESSMIRKFALEHLSQLTK